MCQQTVDVIAASPGLDLQAGFGLCQQTVDVIAASPGFDPQAGFGMCHQTADVIQPALDSILRLADCVSKQQMPLQPALD